MHWKRQKKKGNKEREQCKERRRTLSGNSRNSLEPCTPSCQMKQWRDQYTDWPSQYWHHGQGIQYLLSKNSAFDTL
jgi:hypothetical protein